MEQHGISKLDLKRQNRMHVLKILKQRGPTSRIDIAGALELTRAAVTIITNEMIEQGIIVEIGEYKQVSEKTPRGRKKILIDINHNYKFVLGITVECDVVSVGLSTLAGAVLDKHNLSINAETSGKDIINFASKSAKEILSDNCIDTSSLLGIGVGIFPTMFERLSIPVLDGVPNYTKLMAMIAEHTTLPIVMDSSVKGLAMANIDFMKTKDYTRQNIAFLQYGDTMNFVVTNLNDPIISYDNRTDFIDKIILNPYSSETCSCGRHGCCKSEITPPAIIAKEKRVFSAERTPVLYSALNGDESKINVNNIIESYLKGDEGSTEVIKQVTELVSVLLNNLYYTTNPQRIVLHNFIFTEDNMLKILKDSVKVIAGETVASKICLSIIEDKHRFLSGCALAIRELFFNRGGFDVKNHTYKK